MDGSAPFPDAAARDLLDATGPRQHAKAATRARLLAVAAAMFAAQPYDKVTIRGVARRAGLSTGAVFAHFADKAEIWLACMRTLPPRDDGLTRAREAMFGALAPFAALADDIPAGAEDGRVLVVAGAFGTLATELTVGQVRAAAQAVRLALGQEQAPAGGAP